MFFHIDESGNTGSNLFDPVQPRLSYGVLSSKLNVDKLGVQLHKKILETLQVPALHANQLGVEKLTSVVHLLYELHKKFDFGFDYYYIDKRAYAVVQFFDSVFDEGLNPAVPWHVYWTALRFPMVIKVGSVLTEDMLMESWRLNNHADIGSQSAAIVSLLQKVKKSAESSTLDERAKEVIADALDYAIANPLEMDFGTLEPKMISPNAVCFQFIGTCMARRLRDAKKTDALAVVLDQQQEFNDAQVETYTFAQLIRDGLNKANAEDKEMYVKHPLHHGLNEDDVLRKGVPTKKIEISNSQVSIGLQVVDTYLWIVNRLLAGKNLSKELHALGSLILGKATYDNISIEGMAARWQSFEKILPKFDELTEAELQEYKKKIKEGKLT